MAPKSTFGMFLSLCWAWFLRDVWVQTQTVESIPYSQFENYLEQGLVESITIGSDTIKGTFKSAHNGKTGFVTTPVAPELAERLNAADVTYAGAIENTWFTTLLSWVLPALIFVGIWLLLIRRMGSKQGMGGMMSIGKSKAKVYIESDTKVSFADVAGVDEAKAELQKS